MATEKNVKEVVIPLAKYPHLREDQTLHEASEAIRSFTCGEGGHLWAAEVLVVNGKGQLTGRITILDILQALEPRLFPKEKSKKFEGRESDYPNLAILWETSFLKECRQRAATPIKEVQAPITVVVKVDDPLLKALYLMVRAGGTSLPVLEEDKVVGIVRLEEIFNALCSLCNL